MSSTISKPQLIVALDQCKEPVADRLTAELSEVGVTWFKVGLELYTQTGPAFVKRLKKRGANIFLDLKLYDIPNTVAQAVRAAVETEADLLTLHCSGGPVMLAAAQAAVAGSNLSLLGVTVLTSMGADDFPIVANAWGASATPPRTAVALSLAKIAAESGLSGVVCSVSDLHDGQLRRLNWKHLPPLFITPGIRNSNDATNDQKSVATVTQALLAGSTHLVVGRPITSASNSKEMAQQSLTQLTRGGQK